MPKNKVNLFHFGSRLVYKIDGIENKKMGSIYVAPKMSKEEAKESQGLFYSQDDFSQVVRSHETTQVFIPRGEHGWELLCMLIKKPKLNKLTSDSIQRLKGHAYNASNNRGYAGGFISLKKQSKNVVGLENENRIKSKLIFKDGRVSSYRVGNRVNSGILGYSETASLQRPNQPCRTTAFTEKNPEVWDEVQELARDIASLYRTYIPKAYRAQEQRANEADDFRVQETPFSTVTVNHNWRTATHVDKGDFRGGYTAIYATGKGWNGYLLGYPRYGIAVEMEEGDVVLQNAHEEHCNTEGEGDRLSFVFYLRDGMKHCH